MDAKFSEQTAYMDSKLPELTAVIEALKRRAAILAAVNSMMSAYDSEKKKEDGVYFNVYRILHGEDSGSYAL